MDAAPPSKRHRLPPTFRSLSTLRVLNVIALAASLAAGTGTICETVFRVQDHSAMAATAIPTFVYGVLWAIAMRVRGKFKRTNVRKGWLASIPLAALNGGTCLALLDFRSDLNHLILGFTLGATVGALIWVPALLVVLALYGLPIATAQRLAEKGLAGEERGERFVGLVSAALALLALVALPSAPTDEFYRSFAGGIGRPLLATFGALGALTGVAAAILATYRDRVRRTFVRDVEAGAVAGFRVDATDEGKVLVRVTSQGGGYRAATFDEQVYGLDEAGDARRALSEM